jgi:RimJ/RimL family protein N-acetyltransferase|tara:strand:+ start:26826 stop:27272 length:447 start_codon:yes stop_codon:yes gene_type:complete
MKIVPFETWHFDHIKLSGPEQKMINNYGKTWPNLLDALKYNGATFSWFDRPDVVGICGVMPYWNGVGEAYMFLSEKFKKNKIRCIKDIKYYLNMIANEFKFHRVDCHVIKEFENAVKFAKYLGFEEEAVLKKFGPNKEDYVKLVRFYE